MELINKTDHKFIDISSEEIRIYIYPSGEAINIYKPQWLSVDSKNAHRILDINGYSYYIKPDWSAIKWKVKPGQPHFVK